MIQGSVCPRNLGPVADDCGLLIMERRENGQCRNVTISNYFLKYPCYVFGILILKFWCWEPVKQNSTHFKWPFSLNWSYQMWIWVSFIDACCTYLWVLVVIVSPSHQRGRYSTTVSSCSSASSSPPFWHRRHQTSTGSPYSVAKETYMFTQDIRERIDKTTSDMFVKSKLFYQLKKGCPVCPLVAATCTMLSKTYRFQLIPLSSRL